MVIQSDDKIIAVGYTGNDFAIARYNGNTLSNNEFDLNNQLSLYPNPVKNQLTVDLLNNQNEEIGTYQIIDINGRIILRGSLSNGLNQVNVEDLSKGIYILNAGSLNKKFVKE